MDPRAVRVCPRVGLGRSIVEDEDREGTLEGAALFWNDRLGGAAELDRTSTSLTGSQEAIRRLMRCHRFEIILILV